MECTINMTYITNENFQKEFKTREGLIPVAIDIATQSITWADLGKYHFYEGFFSQSLQQYKALMKEKMFVCTTPVDVLENDLIFSDSIYPHGFIFHSGRCGSTLLSKVLARSEKNIVISEAEPNNDILHILSKHNGEIDQSLKNKKMYQNLVMAMGRRRGTTQHYHVVKFSSYNILFFKFIHHVFPSVPALFISRDKDEVIASISKTPPGWLRSENPMLDQLIGFERRQGVAKMIEVFLKTAQSQPDAALKKVDYTQIKEECLISILKHFNMKADEKEVELMKEQFQYYSKSALNKTKFNKKN